MKSDLLSIVCCPACRQALVLQDAEWLDSEIWTGHLICQSCGTSYSISEGMPHLYVDDKRWATKAGEAEGWVTIHKDLGIYDVQERPVDLEIPYYPEEPWIGVAHSFDIALECLNLTGEECILDLGAGRGWAAKQFALLGCQVVALDVASDNNVGLGRARAIMDDADTYFDRVIGDGENLPFSQNKFDLVFCAAALHHSLNLPLLMHNIGRVLKVGGRLCAIREPCRSVLASERHLLGRDAKHELTVGIVETRPDLPAYMAALAQTNLRPTVVMPLPAYKMSSADLKAWASALGAIRPYIRQRPLTSQLGGWYRYFRRQLLRVLTLNVSIPPMDLPPGERIRKRTELAILLWSGAELFLMAEKHS